MVVPPSSPAAERTGEASVRIGALVPLTRPGRVEAGHHLLAGLELAVRTAAVDELARLRPCGTPTCCVPTARPDRFRTLRTG